MRIILFYCLDMITAIAGFHYGFGLEVVNWWALIGLMIVARFVVKVSSLNKIGGQQ